MSHAAPESWRDSPRSTLDRLHSRYVFSTPLATAVAPLDSDARAALERDVVSGWGTFARDGGLTLELGVLLATARC